MQGEVKYMLTSIDDRILYETINPRDFLNPIVRLSQVRGFEGNRLKAYEATQEHLEFNMSMRWILYLTEAHLKRRLKVRGYKKYCDPNLSVHSHFDPERQYMEELFVSENKKTLLAVRYDGGFRIEEAWIRRPGERAEYLPMMMLDSLRNLIKTFRLGNRAFSPESGRLEENYYKTNGGYPGEKDRLHIVFRKETNPVVR